jgi:predicted protein tyrosine phosphatase
MAPFSNDGGIHEIPLPSEVTGRLWLCGKHHIGRDVDGVMARTGASTVVCLTGRDELVDHYPAYVRWLDREMAGRTVDARAIWFAVHDFSAPPLDEIRPLLDDIAWRLRRRDGVIVHCAGGIGRSGTTAVGVLMVLGTEIDVALSTVRANRPMAGPEVGSQRDLITDLAAALQSGAG